MHVCFCGGGAFAVVAGTAFEDGNRGEVIDEGRPFCFCSGEFLVVTGTMSADCDRYEAGKTGDYKATVI